jgi:hypothetical protein
VSECTSFSYVVCCARVRLPENDRLESCHDQGTLMASIIFMWVQHNMHVSRDRHSVPGISTAICVTPLSVQQACDFTDVLSTTCVQCAQPSCEASNIQLVSSTLACHAEQAVLHALSVGLWGREASKCSMLESSVNHCLSCMQMARCDGAYALT